VSEECRSQLLYIQRRSKSNSADAISKQINTLNEGYNNKEIDVEELSNGLSLVVVKKK